MRRLALLTAILLIGAALRLNGLHAMLGMVHYDEAYYGDDALSLIAEPRLTPFFPDNFGRESLWMYILAPSLAVFGAGAFALRVVAIFTGVLTLAAVYRLARELIGRRAALWSMAALAVLFWHVLASHEAFPRAAVPVDRRAGIRVFVERPPHPSAASLDSRGRAAGVAVLHLSGGARLAGAGGADAARVDRAGSAAAARRAGRRRSSPS